uniref:ATP synthase complex subunit 8 n=1 Tax=Noteridae sp. MJTNT-2012 TaxID=1227477 RepID=S4SVZ9_9COLE|nr:ATP synthase F0 subunit 8 [Noteridae sp. MJTNT-2012]
MPQMAPMNWYILFIMFIIILIMFNVINFYMSIPTPKTSTSQTRQENKTTLWKW